MMFIQNNLEQRPGGDIIYPADRVLFSGAVKFSLGTDAPVVPLNLFVNTYNAVTRLDEDGSQYDPYTADQVLTLPEVLKGYTVCSGKVVFER